MGIMRRILIVAIILLSSERSHWLNSSYLSQAWANNDEAEQMDVLFSEDEPVQDLWLTENDEGEIKALAKELEDQAKPAKVAPAPSQQPASYEDNMNALSRMEKELGRDTSSATKPQPTIVHAPGSSRDTSSVRQENGFRRVTKSCHLRSDTSTGSRSLGLARQAKLWTEAAQAGWFKVYLSNGQPAYLSEICFE